MAGKSTIFILPALGTVLFIGITILNRYPLVFNYPVRIAPWITAWLTPLMMALVFIPLGYYIFKSFRNK